LRSFSSLRNHFGPSLGCQTGGKLVGEGGVVLEANGNAL